MKHAVHVKTISTRVSIGLSDGSNCTAGRPRPLCCRSLPTHLLLHEPFDVHPLPRILPHCETHRVLPVALVHEVEDLFVEDLVERALARVAYLHTRFAPRKNPEQRTPRRQTTGTIVRSAVEPTGAMTGASFRSWCAKRRHSPPEGTTCEPALLLLSSLSSLLNDALLAAFCIQPAIFPITNFYLAEFNPASLTLPPPLSTRRAMFA